MLDAAMASAARGDGSPVSPQLRTILDSSEFKGKVQSAMEHRYMELSGENDRYRHNQYSKVPSNPMGQSALENIDRDQWPTKVERQAIWNAGKSLGMSVGQIASLPAIKVVGNLDPTPIIREAISQLHSSKMPAAMWEEYSINKIAFLDQRMLPEKYRGVLGYVDSAFRLERDASRLRVVHIMSDAKGDFPKGKELLWTLSHEIFHLHELQSSEFLVFQEVTASKAWRSAVAAQLKIGPVSLYSIEDLFETGQISGTKTRDPEEIDLAALHSEFVCEHFAAWVTNSKHDFNDGIFSYTASPLCKEMTKFFDTYVPKTFI